MEMFKRTRDGGVSVAMSADEAMLLRALVVPVMRLLGMGSGRGTGAGATASTDADTIDDLESQFSDEQPETPQDPVLARLLPDAYRDDPEAADEFRKYTESSLRESKKYFAQTLLDTLPASGGRVRLTGDQARDWLRTLNDVRLMFGVRLEVTEDFEEQLAALEPADPKIMEFEVYGWLGAIQESLVQALAR
jgi:hypothetical protein